MDSALQKRVEKIRELKDKFRIDQNTLATYSGKSRTTVSIVLVQSDERYLTESNISAIEAGIEKILDEYRKELCVSKEA
ncbi:hypothetical protein QNI19_26780 [Cytophagaceae bacterium DM2B3-1]|uniref:HTH cro/C1-type domain-containing protein n=1 Tax=Xanthocytophaga flava TaxID=3048013 RepID=A0ABT7CUF3_9BACT|nr:hypothetical protein [Xanthocytophaga flavus]MDJ1496567.1 hypothetical protein [Xanthocytophaga flavus]